MWMLKIDADIVYLWEKQSKFNNIFTKNITAKKDKIEQQIIWGSLIQQLINPPIYKI